MDLLNAMRTRIREYKLQGDKTIAKLAPEELHHVPAGGSNSIAIIIRHLHGNMLSRWTNFLTEDGEKEWRNRDDEFETIISDKETLLQLWEKGWQVYLDAMDNLTTDDLQRTITIRNEPLIVADALVRQLLHYAAHVGQIVYLGKMIRGDAWETLSIPKKGSEQWNKTMAAKFEKGAHQ